MFDEVAPIDEASKRKRRRRRRIVATIIATLLAWPVVFFLAIDAYATSTATTINWDRSYATAVPDRFAVLMFPVTADPSCTAALAGFNRAAIEQLDELNAPEVEVFILNAPVHVDRRCFSFLPSPSSFDSMIANLKVEIRSWGPANTDWLDVEASHRVLPSAMTEIRFKRRTEKHSETFIYQTDGTTLTPVRWESLSALGRGITAGVLLLLAVAVHFVLIIVALIIAWARRRRRRVIGIRA